ncbi:hypothetical protein MED193_04561 [Roseobacter sp. MED193]|nr:hypothetical protein MED193_04561 [Roseobacter sp. MED193]
MALACCKELQHARTVLGAANIIQFRTGEKQMAKIALGGPWGAAA